MAEKFDLLIWNDDMDTVCGRISDFKNQKEFEEAVKEAHKQYQGTDCIVVNIEKDSCISTCDGIDSESIVRLKDTDIEIAIFYMADIGEE